MSNQNQISSAQDDKNIPLETPSLKDAKPISVAIDVKIVNEKDALVQDVQTLAEGAEETDEELGPGRNKNDGYYADGAYLQQQVAGQPVYVQGPPANAARAPAYRRGNDPDDNYPTDFSNIGFGRTFDSREVRNKFIRKVYMILSVQLLFTTGFIAMCIYVKKIKYFVLTSFYLMIMASVLFFVSYIALLCYVTVRRSFPGNFLLLCLLTASLAYIMAFTSCTYSTFIVMSSMGITAAVCVIISLIAVFACCDLTQRICAVFLCIFSIIVLIFGIVAMILTLVMNMSILWFIYSCLIALLFSLYLMYDTQKIVGGRSQEMSEEEYILGAILLYIDIMYIFWAILSILGFRR